MSLEDRFDIGQPIHIGQIATAYPAVEKEHNRRVLLKVIHPQWTNDSELVERFHREGQAMERIDHPNVVRMIEYGSEGDAPYLVLEWVNGGTLAEKIASGPLPQDRIKRIAGDLLCGLRAVHTEGLLHRDIKPDNILLDRDGRAILADFSLVGFEQMSGLTGHGAVVGSPAYMAPELLDGSPATQRCDLYGIGLILLEALTGSNPFVASDPVVSLDLVRRANPPKLTGRSQIDPDLAKLVDALLKRDPKDRPQSADEALKLIRTLDAEEMTMEQSDIPDQPMGAGDFAPSIPHRARNWRIRPKWAGLWIASILVVIVLLISNLYIFPPFDRDKRDTLSTSIIGDGAIPIDAEIVIPDELIVNPSESIVSSTSGVVIPAPKIVIPAEAGTQSVDDNNPINRVGGDTGIGYVTIIARPWANVSVDDRTVGVTPAVGTLELDIGQHTFLFEHESLPSVRRDMNVIGGRRDTIDVDMRAGTARVVMIISPWGYLWVDGDSVGMFPRQDTEPLWLSSGEHRFEVKRPGQNDWSDSLTLEGGAQLDIRIDLKLGTMIAVNNVGG